MYIYHTSYASSRQRKRQVGENAPFNEISHRLSPKMVSRTKKDSGSSLLTAPPHGDVGDDEIDILEEEGRGAVDEEDEADDDLGTSSTRRPLKRRLETSSQWSLLID